VEWTKQQRLLAAQTSRERKDSTAGNLYENLASANTMVDNRTGSIWAWRLLFDI